jgi:hypothetical protein
MAERLTKSVIVLITFMACWVILVGFIPSQFYVYAKEYTSYDYPDYFTKEDIETLKYFINQTITYPDIAGTEYNFDNKGASGTYVVVRWWSPAGQEPRFHFLHETWRFWVFKSYENMHFVYQTYDTFHITLDILTEFWDASRNVTRLRPISCPTLSLTVFFSDTNTARNNIEDAWNDGEINVGIGFGMDDWEAKYSSWTLIAKLLTFQAPEIDPILNGIIAIPFWACTCIVIVLILVKFIPFGGS